MATISWNVDADGDWSTTADWNPQRLPDLSDAVVINTTDFHTITHSTGTDTVSSLTVGNDDFVLSGGTLTITNGASFANTLTISGGTLALAASAVTVSGLFVVDGGPGTVTGSATLTLAGGADFNSEAAMTGTGTTVLKGASAVASSDVVGLDGARVLENQGTLTFGNGANIQLGDNPLGTTVGGGTLRNDSGATIDFIGSGITNAVSAGSGTVSFTNAGLVENTGAGDTQIGVAFTNTGTVSVKAGELDFEGGGTSGATAFTIAAGATLGFGGGTFTLGAGTIGGAGTTKVFGGTLALAASAVTVSGLFAVSGGPATVSGSATLTLAGGADFNSEAAMTGTGATVLKGASAVASSDVVGLDGARVLENQGTLTFGNGASIQLGDNPLGKTVGGGTLRNDSGATIDFIGSGITNAVSAGSGTVSFTNAGLVENTGAGDTQIGVAFTNTGTVDVTSGTLDLSAATLGNLSGTTLAGGIYVVDAGSKLQLPNNATIVTLAADLTVSGAGSVVESLDTGTSAQVPLENTLTTIAAGGALRVLGGRNYVTANAIADGGLLQLGGGTFTAASLTVTGKGKVTGIGTLAERLIVDPGAVFQGTLDGNGSNTIELAGTTPGVLNGLGTSLSNFAAVTVDAGASWTVYARAAALGGVNLTGNDVSSTLTLTSAGTFSLSKVSKFGRVYLAAGNNAVTVTDATLSGGAVVIIHGASGNNSISAAGDTSASKGKTLSYVAGIGTDSFAGGFENDVVRVTAAAIAGDTLTGGSGANTLILTTAGTFSLSGVSKFGAIDLFAGNNAVTVTDATLSGGAVVIHHGASGNNSINAAGDTSASTGKTLTYIVGSGSDTFSGGFENDVVNASGDTSASKGQTLTFTAGSGTDRLTGGFENDVIKVTAAAVGGDALTGGSGANTLILTTAGTINAGGVSGVETYQLASTGANTLTLGNGNFANVTGDSIHVVGGAAGNTVDASKLTGTNEMVFTGRAGADIIVAGPVTSMTGGAGANQFTFAEIGSNLITDFKASASNEMVFRNSGFDLGGDDGKGTGSPQHLDASVFVANSTASFTTTSQRFAYNTTNGTLSYAADGSGSTGSSPIVNLADQASLHAGALGNLFFTA